MHKLKSLQSILLWISNIVTDDYDWLILDLTKRCMSKSQSIQTPCSGTNTNTTKKARRIPDTKLNSIHTERWLTQGLILKFCIYQSYLKRIKYRQHLESQKQKSILGGHRSTEEKTQKEVFFSENFNLFFSSLRPVIALWEAQNQTQDLKAWYLNYTKLSHSLKYIYIVCNWKIAIGLTAQSVYLQGHSENMILNEKESRWGAFSFSEISEFE